MTSQTKHKLIAFLTGIVILYFLLFFPYVGFLKNLIRFVELKAYDLDTRIVRGTRKPSDDIIIVNIDDASFEELGVFPWPRTFHGKLINILNKHKAKIIAFDVDFSQKGLLGVKNDLYFANEAKKSGNVILVNTFTVINDPDFTSITRNYPIKILRDNILCYGFSNTEPDEDGVIRNYSLKKEHQNETNYSFAVEVTSKYIRVDEGFLLKMTKTNQDKDSILINYFGRARNFRNISYYEVLEEKFESDFFKDKIVLIGATSELLHDVFFTPFGQMPGVEIHANVINSILKNDFLDKTDGYINKIISSIVGLITIILVIRFSPFVSLITTLVFVTFFELLFSYIFKIHNLWVDTITPVVAVFFTYSGVTVARYFTEGRIRKKIKNLFMRYVSPEVVNEILKQPDKVDLGGKKIPVAILFSDIRGFTSLTERLEAEVIVDVLNEYFTEMTNVILEYGGALDKFIGDAILAVFSVPFPKEDDPIRAVKVALKMREKLNVLREKWKAEGKEIFNIGIGLDYGEVVAGNIGSKVRMNYTVIGDAVNTASRLEGLTKEFHKDIIISDRIYEKVRNIVNVEPLGEYPVRGKKEHIFIYELLGLR